MLARILVIEDEAKWFEEYKDILGENWELDLAENVQKAKALLEKSTYHLVLLDICLNWPDFDLDCQQFVSFLRRQYPTLPIVVTTGKPLELPKLDFVFQLGEGGIVDFMHKTHLETLDFRGRIQLAENKYPLAKKTPTKSFEYDVFISYSHSDKDWTQNWLLPQLEEAGFRVCIDIRDFKPGVSNVKEMERAVVQSRKTLPILTSSYFDSKWAEYEIIMTQTLSSATGEGRLIPLLLKPCELPLSIRTLVYVDFTTPEKANLQLKRLIDAIKS